MFTGIVTSMGEVLSVAVGSIRVRARYQDVVMGESIAVDGVCLTVAAQAEDSLCFDISSETMACTQLGAVQAGDRVHLERALRLCDRLGGHWVSGHVDKTVRILARTEQEGGVYLRIGPFSPQDHAYLVPKGSIAVHGVSLTINGVVAEAPESILVELMLIPTTCAHTRLGALQVGDLVHIEFDQLAKMVHHQVEVK